MQEETERINRTLTGAKRKAALYTLLEEETELIACIGMHKLSANLENQQKAILHFLGKVSNYSDHKEYQSTGTDTPAKYKKYLFLFLTVNHVNANIINIQIMWFISIQFSKFLFSKLRIS